jgi:hypothetical protein
MRASLNTVRPIAMAVFGLIVFVSVLASGAYAFCFYLK